ncbi:patatin-like phospholipase family protein [Parvularcula sp. IMCC14364]|uniref:patatin-like phospholipase family protein n=1 Tax=Parvularcula sp. IMCC14364 TaxID=3067902 RepID=UPI0027425146|nr:patatin-like phospholipase family protein [Parvularcula sp. IMCC14364]
MTKSNTKRLDIALQGGGAHGAFAWGVLDYLLEDGRVEFSSITAASAGAMNATIMCYGMTLGGPEQARQCLHNFWEDIGKT